MQLPNDRVTEMHVSIKLVLFVGSLLALLAIGWVSIRGRPIRRPDLAAGAWLATGFAATSFASLLGVREGVALYVLGFGGLVALAIGVYKLFNYRSSLRDR